MKYREIHRQLDCVARYNRILAGLDPPPKNRKFKNMIQVEKARDRHEAKAAALLVEGIKKPKQVGVWGSYTRTEKHLDGWYEKVTAAKNAKRIAAGLEPYRAVGNAKNKRKR